MSEKENRSEADRSRLGDKESFVNTASDDSNWERRGDNQLVPERATLELFDLYCPANQQ